MTVGIVAQRENPRAASVATDVYEALANAGEAVVVDEETAPRIETAADDVGVPAEEMAACDLVVSIGGDGTFLYAARAAGTTPIMGINLGEVGFLNAVSPADAVDAVRTQIDALRENGEVAARSMTRLRARGEGWALPPAINEVAVLGPQRGHGQGLDLTVSVDGSTYTDGHADGVLVATPTGSTAYNLSEDGPLVHPGVDGLVLTPMAGVEPMPSLVVDQDSDVRVAAENASAVIVASDGRVGQRLDTPATVDIGTAENPIRIAGPPLDFFAALDKLE